MWLMVQAGAQACQEKPPCLYAYPANQPRAGARRAGQDGKLEAFGSGPSLEGGGGNSSLGRGGLSLPPQARLGGAGLTYWKGRRTARMSPLKKSVMSSTKITPWQEVKSNYRDRTGVSCGACPGGLRISRGPRWAACWPEGRGLHGRSQHSSSRRPPQTPLAPFTSP